MEALKKTFEIASNPNYIKGAVKQLYLTLNDQGVEHQEIDTQRDIIVFLPGWTCSGLTYQKLTKELQKLGKIVITPDNLPKGLKAIFFRKGIEEQADLVLEYLEKITPELKNKKVTILGHSTGGLVGIIAKIKEIENGTRERINQIITLSSPLKADDEVGRIPFVSSYVKAVRDLRSEAPIQKKLESSIENVPVTSFVAKSDEIFKEETQYRDEKDVIYVEGGHFDYFSGKEEIIEKIAEKVSEIINEESARSTIENE